MILLNLREWPKIFPAQEPNPFERPEGPRRIDENFVCETQSARSNWDCRIIPLRYAAPSPGVENYVREGRFGPLGDVQQCRQTRKARLDAYVRSGWAPYWGVEGKQHVVFDQLCHHPVMEVIQGSHFVSLAGVGHLKGRAYGYRQTIDISWPEMPVAVEDPVRFPCGCHARPRLVSFQGAGTRTVRTKLLELHDGEEVVIHVADVSQSALNTTDARWDVSHPQKAAYAALMRESDFALAPAGHSQCSLRLYEILSFCTVPVIMADEKLLPFSEILNWSQFAIFVPESEALEVVPRLRAISAEQRCEMRHRAHQAFHTYFANVSSNVRGLMEVLKLHWLQGFGPNEDSRKLTEEFEQLSSLLSWSPLAKEDFHLRRTTLERLGHGAFLDQDNDGRISWGEVLIHDRGTHDASREALTSWSKVVRGATSDEDDLESLVTKAFQRLDADHDGQLSRREFQVNKLNFEKLDLNNDSHIALRELLWDPLLSSEIRIKTLQQGFRVADENKDGHLSASELERPLAQHLLHLLEDAERFTAPDALHHCGRLWAPADESDAVRALEECGYLHLLPGLFTGRQVSDMFAVAKKFNCSEAPADAFESQPLPGMLQRLLQAAMRPDECCDQSPPRAQCLPEPE
ncbi:unnamed protein product, partial [Durusdinium trenchii]